MYVRVCVRESEGKRESDKVLRISQNDSFLKSYHIRGFIPFLSDYIGCSKNTDRLTNKYMYVNTYISHMPILTQLK